MKTKLIFTSLLCFLLMGSHKFQNPNEFIINGTVNGDHTEYLILGYWNNDNIYVRDTLSIDNGKFFTTGILNNPQSVTIHSNLAANDMNDPNVLSFFIEPITIEIKLIENQFKEAKISGSNIQLEYEAFKSITQPMYDAIQPLMLKWDALSEKRKKSTDTIATDKEMEYVQKEWDNKLLEIEQIKLRYAKENPGSYIGAYSVKSFAKTMSKDSLKVLYDNFDEKIVLSSYGRSIKDVLDFHLVIAGDFAPNFVTTDVNGNLLNLEQFRGKYVLLDFWAGWCVPCIKKHPELKKLYKQYHALGLEIIGISLDIDELSWKESIEKENVEWHNVFVGRANYHLDNSIYKIYGVQPIPAYILIDKDGYVVDRYLNADKQYKDIDVLQEKLKELFD